MSDYNLNMVILWLTLTQHKSFANKGLAMSTAYITCFTNKFAMNYIAKNTEILASPIN